MRTIDIIHEGADPTSGRQGDEPRPRPARRSVSRPATPDSRRRLVPEAPALDPQAAREYVEQVQEVLDRVAPEPHKVTFRRDDTTNGFVIEVRNPDGSIVRQYPPEKLLNLRRKLDELSGMVIDEMT